MIKQLYCDFYPYCAKGEKCSKRLTVDVFNNAISKGKIINRSDCFADHPDCFIEKNNNNICIVEEQLNE